MTLHDFVPLLLMLALALGLALTLLKAAEWLGPHRPTRVKESPYESGMDPVGTARERFSIKFYLVAMLFIIFDVEVVFMYPFAASFQTFIAEGQGAPVLIVALIFLAVLGIGLLYEMRKGGAKWDWPGA